MLLSNPDSTWDISTALADAHKAENDFGLSGLHIKQGSTADVNNDGYPDIFVESGGGSQQLLSHVYYNNGNNTFPLGGCLKKFGNIPLKGLLGFGDNRQMLWQM